MTEEPLPGEERCFVCGTKRDLEWHEPAGRENEDKVRVRLCKRCHNRQTYIHQADYGLDLAEGERSDLDQASALFQGIPPLFAEQIRAEDGDETLAGAFERSVRSNAAAIEAMAHAFGEQLRHPGPDPIANDRRRKRRARSRPFWSDPPVSEQRSEDDERTEFSDIIKTLSAIVESVLGPMGDVTDAPQKWSEISADPDGLFDRLSHWDGGEMFAKAVRATFPHIRWLAGFNESVARDNSPDHLIVWINHVSHIFPIVDELEAFLLCAARGDKRGAELALDTLTEVCESTQMPAISPSLFERTL